MTRVGVVGASARAAVHSLARAGHSAWAVDQFADRDLARVAECRACPSADYPDAIPRLASQFPPGPVLYTGGLENHPHIVAELASQRKLFGNPPDVLARVRDPFVLFPALSEAGFLTPRLVPHGAPCPLEGRWLRKPLRSGAGLGIRFARPGEAASPAHYFQEFIDGTPMSAQFVSDALLGVTEQLVGERWLHAAPFAYCGNVGRIALPARIADALQQLGRVLVDSFDTRGVCGVDFVLADVPHGLEVNPRYTAAIEVLEHATGLAAYRGRPIPPAPLPEGKGVNARVASSESLNAPEPRGSFSPFPSGRGAGGVGLHVAKAVYYAPHAIRFPQRGPWDDDLAGAFDPWRLPTFADIPEPGAVIARGHPVLTFFATGSTPAEVRERLQSRAAALDRIFQDAHL